MDSNCSFISNGDGFTVFKYDNYTIRFKAPYSLERYTDIVEWDKESEEEYIDLVPILENLYIEPEAFLKPIKEVRIDYG